ncbi:M48 family metallopeptidase [Helicobacter apodemus]|uniref:Peptidase M48 family protein n=1 Tax=Helicobacter apodemus TaxID=135569 RepID=A0A2U8FF42_9HELI|nr:M48 family metallopeptidase [Helicobacter apodemus]AWI34774.1 peptidase M48 family protein [Helicobacter apodemus]
MRKIVFICCLGFFFYACSSTDYTNRSRFMLLDEKEEKALGEQSAKEILKQSKLSFNKAQKEMVERVGWKIANVVKREDFEWKFYLIEEDQKNAFCLPGGKVFVYTGLMGIIDSDDELAVVISHEIAHALLRHGGERMSMQTLTQLGGNILGAIVGVQAPAYSSLINQAYNLGSNVGVILPFSRSHELEADKLGILLLQKAGYNPQAALSFWQKMSEDSNKGSDFFSTHPSDSKRIEAIQNLLKDND